MNLMLLVDGDGISGRVSTLGNLLFSRLTLLFGKKLNRDIIIC